MATILSLTAAQHLALKDILTHIENQEMTPEYKDEVGAILVKLNKEPKQAKITEKLNEQFSQIVT